MAISPTNELVILTKFQNNWIKIVDFYHQPNFWPLTFFFVKIIEDEAFFWIFILVCAEALCLFVGASETF